MRLKTAAIIVAALTLGACTVSKSDAGDALSAAGLHDVTYGGFAMWGCGHGDNFTRTFKATTADGRKVKGVVCGGFLKGHTVRITGRA